MELRIKCDAKVDLIDFVNLINVMCEIKEYELKDETLNGYVCVKGNYIKDDMQTSYEFLENVPFTVVFNAKNLKLERLEIEDFLTNEVVNHGIECKFNIVITYKEEEKAEPIIIENQEKPKEEITQTKNDSFEELEDEKDPVTTENDFIEKSEDEQVKNDIIQKYDELLNKILESRDDNFLEENEEEISEDDSLEIEAEASANGEEVAVEENKKVYVVKSSDNKLRPTFNNISDNYASYRIYYPHQESELEKICSQEKVSIEKIYQDNANKDFKKKKRIIIK